MSDEEGLIWIHLMRKKEMMEALAQEAGSKAVASPGGSLRARSESGAHP